MTLLLEPEEVRRAESVPHFILFLYEAAFNSRFQCFYYFYFFFTFCLFVFIFFKSVFTIIFGNCPSHTSPWLSLLTLFYVCTATATLNKSYYYYKACSKLIIIIIFIVFSPQLHLYLLLYVLNTTYGNMKLCFPGLGEKQ